MTDPIVTTTLAPIAKKILDDIFNAAEKSLGKIVVNWLNKNQIKNTSKTIGSRVHELAKVKTIWQLDREVDISEFFVAPYLLIDGQKKISITSIIDIAINDGNLLIQGMPGHGKSVLMRKLAISCLKEINLIPIFIQLRDIDANSNLELEIINKLLTLGITKASSEYLHSILHTGKFALFLDGFDELLESIQNTIRINIESLAIRHCTLLPIIISTRVNETIEYSTGFRRGRLQPLEQNSQTDLIEKLVDNDKDKLVLIKAIKQHQGEITTLLQTPLMVVILIVVFRAERKVPETFSEFYDHLLFTLLSRHDGTKPGFTRAKRTKLGTTEFSKLFEAFCFMLRSDSIGVSFLVKDGINSVQKASDLMNIPVDPEAYIADIKKITGLLIEEGLKLHFIHRTIHQYFCAAYIARREDDAVKQFYKHLLNSEEYSEWLQELGFLRKLDSVRFYRYFYLDRANELLRNIELDPTTTSSPIPEIWKKISVISVISQSGTKTFGFVLQSNIDFIEYDYINSFFIPLLQELSKNPNSYLQLDTELCLETLQSLLVTIAEFAATRSLVHDVIRIHNDAVRMYKYRINEATKLLESENQRKNSLLALPNKPLISSDAP